MVGSACQLAPNVPLRMIGDTWRSVTNPLDENTKEPKDSALRYIGPVRWPHT